MFTVLFYIGTNKNGTLDMGIDFLIRQNRKVVPIEVKSGDRFSTKSLDKFKKKFNDKIGIQYILYDGDIKVDGEVIRLSYFMTSIL